MKDYKSLCSNCIHEARHKGSPVTMLTGYCLSACKCDCCGRPSDLAMTQREVTV